MSKSSVMFVHLLSNASTNVFPNNKLGDFSTILAQPLKLYEDDWEVGIAEIHIPFSFNMVTKDDAWFELLTITPGKKVGIASSLVELREKFNCFVTHVNDDHFEVKLPSDVMLELSVEHAGLPKQIFGDTDRVYVGAITKDVEIKGPFNIMRTSTSSSGKITIPHGFFNTTDDLLKAFFNDTFQLSTVDGGHVRCTIKQEDLVKRVILRLPDHVSNILGFRTQSIQATHTTALHHVDTFPGLNCILVYSNIIEDSFVGDTQAPLLRVLPFKQVKRNQMMSYECYPIQYKKVLQQDIDCIHIRLIDDSGRRLPFTGIGRVALTLHFRRRQHGSIYSH